jgi:hypothetical protein
VPPPTGVLRHHLRWPTTTTRDNRGTDDDGMTTAEPTTVVVVVVPAATPPPPPLTATTATPHGPSTSTPRPAPFRCGPIPGGGGVDIQQPLPSAMLADSLPYDLPPQQADPTFVPPLAHLPPAAWTPWTTPGAPTHDLPPQQVAPTFVPPLEHPPQAVWTLWTASSTLPYGLPPQ